MAPEALAQVLRPLVEQQAALLDERLLVGLEGADDAAVWKLREDEAIVATADFFAPVVDDPGAYGAIAAANAMSDVFAMGGEVLFALNLVAFPESLPAETIAAIVRGGATKVLEAGGMIVGGHSVYDAEPKYGLAVVGRVHPRRILLKSGARPGDHLVLTKPLGTGLITTALKRGLAEPAHVAAAVETMTALNAAAGRAAVAAGAHAATDVTGFGLIGHAMEMALAGGVRFAIDSARLPLLPGAAGYAAAGIAPGGTARNREAYLHAVAGLEALADTWSDILFDPQTSGGLLIALAPDALDGFVAAMVVAGGSAHVIGTVVDAAGAPGIDVV